MRNLSNLTDVGRIFIARSAHESLELLLIAHGVHNVLCCMRVELHKRIECLLMERVELLLRL